MIWDGPVSPETLCVIQWLPSSDQVATEIAKEEMSMDRNRHMLFKEEKPDSIRERRDKWILCKDWERKRHGCETDRARETGNASQLCDLMVQRAVPGGRRENSWHASHYGAMLVSLSLFDTCPAYLIPPRQFATAIGSHHQSERRWGVTPDWQRRDGKLSTAICFCPSKPQVITATFLLLFKFN